MSSSAVTSAVDPVRGHVESGGPDDRIQDELAEIGVAPVLVEVGAREAEAAAAIGPLDGPGEHLLAALGLEDVLVRPTRRGRDALRVRSSGLATRIGVTPFISGRKRMLKYHSSPMAKGFTPALIGCLGSDSISAFQCGLVE